MRNQLVLLVFVLIALGVVLLYVPVHSRRKYDQGLQFLDEERQIRILIWRLRALKQRRH